MIQHQTPLNIEMEIDLVIDIDLDVDEALSEDPEDLDDEDDGSL